MNDEHKRTLVEEANDSFRILIQFLGMLDTRANLLFLKWPDAMQSLISNDLEMFKKDMSILICQPIYVLATSLREYSSRKTGKSNDMHDIELVMDQSIVDPIEVKKTLLRICNTEIFLLKSKGHPIEQIQGRDANDRNIH